MFTKLGKSIYNIFSPYVYIDGKLNLYIWLTCHVLWKAATCFHSEQLVVCFYNLVQLIRKTFLLSKRRNYVISENVFLFRVSLKNEFPDSFYYKYDNFMLLFWYKTTNMQKGWSNIQFFYVCLNFSASFLMVQNSLWTYKVNCEFLGYLSTG